MTEPVGWQVLDPDGNVVASGPVTVLEMTTALAEGLDLDTKDSDGGDRPEPRQ